MPIYETKPRADAYGYCVGVLMLDIRQPFIPGDVGNATSYDYPVLYRTVPGAHPSRVFVGDPELDEAVVETALELQAQGVKGISSDCGFFINFQDLVREAVDIPVFMSSLLQLPLISSMLASDKSIGVMTADSTALGNQVLELSGIEPDRELVISGMQDNSSWKEAYKDPAEVIDSDLIEQQMVNTAMELKESSPNMGAIVLECSLMPPYARAVQDATGLPVFDFLNVIDLFQQGTHRKSYSGYY